MKTKSLFMSLAMVIIIPLTSCKKDLKDIIAETKQATCTVYTYDEYGSPSGSGSGFFIDENGTAITNFHVLDGSTKAVIKTEDGVEYAKMKVTIVLKVDGGTLSGDEEYILRKKGTA